MGDTKGGAFDIFGNIARTWLKAPLNPNGRPNSDVLRPRANGLDVTRRPRDMWIIDFGFTMSEAQAALYQQPFEYAAETITAEATRFAGGNHTLGSFLVAARGAAARSLAHALKRHFTAIS